VKRLSLVLLVLLIGCTGIQVENNSGLVGYYNYGPTLEKVVAARVKACEGVEGCVPAELTEQDVLSLITSVKNKMESEGASVIGVEGAKFRIWFEK
jgi:hypothetical protein